MSRRRRTIATKGCPNCNRPHVMKIVFLTKRGAETEELHKAIVSVWRCERCSARRPHE